HQAGRSLPPTRRPAHQIARLPVTSKLEAMNSHQRVAQTLSGSRSDKRQQSNCSWDENVPRPSINSQSRLLLRSLDMEDAVGATRKCFFMPAERRKPTGLRTKSAPSKCHRIARGESFRKSAIASRGSSWSASKACAAA